MVAYFQRWVIYDLYTYRYKFMYTYLYLYVQRKILYFVLLMLAGCDRMNKWFGLATVIYNERGKVIIHVWTDCAIIVQFPWKFGPHSSSICTYEYFLAYYGFICSLPAD